MPPSEQVWNCLRFLLLCKRVDDILEFGQPEVVPMALAFHMSQDEKREDRTHGATLAVNAYLGALRHPAFKKVGATVKISPSVVKQACDVVSDYVKDLPPGFRETFRITLLTEEHAS